MLDKRLLPLVFICVPTHSPPPFSRSPHFLPTHTCVYSCTYTYTHMHTHARTHTHTHTHTHTRTHTCTHTHTHAHTRTHMCTHTHTHTHTQGVYVRFAKLATFWGGVSCQHGGVQLWPSGSQQPPTNLLPLPAPAA